MKALVSVLTLVMLAVPAFAAKVKVLASIDFKHSSAAHRYSLIDAGRSNDFKLVFVDGHKPPMSKPLSKSEADGFRNQIDRIRWSSADRKHSSTKRCSQYAEINSGVASTTVCAENKKATALAYGLLNSVSRAFGIK